MQNSVKLKIADCCKSACMQLVRSFPDCQMTFACRNVDVLHLATNIRYVFECREWVSKSCKNERVLLKPYVQHPPIPHEDWRITEVYPAQVHTAMFIALLLCQVPLL